MATAAPQRTGVARFDHGAALAYYVALDPPRRYADVARKFGVSETSIRKWARRDDWAGAAEEADRKAAASVLARAERTREQRAAQTAKIRDLAADRIESGLTPNEKGHVALDDNAVLQAWKEADRQYRLDIGEVTDRISIPEVREFVGRFVGSIDELLVAVLDESLANGKRAIVLRAFRERMPAVLEQAAVLEAASS